MAENFHTLALDGVPVFGLHNRTAAYRFVTLVDVSLFSYSIRFKALDRWIFLIAEISILNGNNHIQVMYENKARLMCTAEGTPFQLFERIVTISDAQSMAPRTSSRSRKNDDYDLCVDNELGFAKDRTISRYYAFFSPLVYKKSLYHLVKHFVWILKMLFDDFTTFFMLLRITILSFGTKNLRVKNCGRF